jgi:hypothetical protein
VQHAFRQQAYANPRLDSACCLFRVSAGAWLRRLALGLESEKPWRGASENQNVDLVAAGRRARHREAALVHGDVRGSLLGKEAIKKQLDLPMLGQALGLQPWL